MRDSAPGTLPVPAGAILVLILLAIPLFFVGIGSSGLSEPDEPYYAVPALEMLRTGTWEIPVFRGEPWFDKPVLYYWVVMASYGLLGVSDGVTRLGAALAGLGAVLCVFAFVRRKGVEQVPALVCAIVLATSVEVPIVARMALTDMMLTLFITFGMLAAARYLENRSATAILAAGAAFGLAVLTKGPVGILLPGVALLAYLTLARRWRALAGRDLLISGIGFSAIVAPWYGSMALRHRDLLVQGFIGRGNVGRFLEPEHPAFPLYYVVVLAVGLLPWSGLLPAALLDAARPPSWRSEREGKAPGPLFDLCWFGAVLTVFSFSASKLPTYILPAFPAAALLIGRYWTNAFDSHRTRRRRLDAWSIGLCVILAAATTVGLTIVARKPLWSAGALPLVAIGFAFLGGAALAAVSFRRRSLRGWVAWQAGASVVAILLVVGFAYPLLEAYRSTRDLVAGLERDGVAEEVVAAYGIQDYSIDFYLRRTVPRIESASSLREVVAKEPGRVWILRSVELPALRADRSLDTDTVREGPRWSAVRLGPSLDGSDGGTR
jgi:4-amino-4-deoxy-L-arabinose transferase-like glycosyltransferase